MTLWTAAMFSPVSPCPCAGYSGSKNMVAAPRGRSPFASLCRFALLTVLSLWLFLCQGLKTIQAAEPPPSRSDAGAVVIALQPLGGVRASRIAAARSALEARYHARVVVLPNIPLPKTAYYPPRKRWRADRLLHFLESVSPKKPRRTIIGLTEEDISATKGPHPDWGVFGLGAIGGRACIVSTFRLRRNAGERRLHERIGKVAVHEVGHTLGLEHCPVPGCVMADAAGTVRTVDTETGVLCLRCRRTIGTLAR